MRKAKKVYVITKGEYSDYHICAVASNINTAEKLCKAYTDSYHTAHIEEYDLNENADDARIMYCVEIECDDIEVTVNSFENKEHAYGDKDYFTAYVLAKDRDHAVKIAQDRRAEYLAKKEGVV